MSTYKFNVFTGRYDLVGVTTFTGDTSVFNTRLENLEQDNEKVTYYEIINISATTSGSITKPTNSTIQEDEFGESGNSVLSTLTALGKPTFESPEDNSGNTITANLAVDGSWIASGTYADQVALIYRLTIPRLYSSGLTENKIIDYHNISGLGINDIDGLEAELESKLEVSAFTNYTASTVDTFVTGFTYTPSANTLTIERNQNLSDLDVLISSFSGLTIGDLTITNSLSGITHNTNLEGLQGGQSNEYYHVTKDIYDALTGATSASSTNVFATLDDINTSSGDTKQVKVSSNDTTEGYLGDKITGSTYINKSTLNDGGNEIVEISLNKELLDNTYDSRYVNNTGDTISGSLNIISDLTITGNTYAPTITATTIFSDYIQFNPDYSGTTAVEGRMFWDDANGTVSLGMHGSNVSQQIGLEYYYYIKNQSGATIENGKVVRAVGTLGSSGRILGEYMIADGSVHPKYSLGIATEDIVNGDDGYVTEFGLVRDLNTTGSLYGETWSEGDILWVSPTISGGLTNVEPTPPQLKIEMAIVVKTGTTNGSIFVRPTRYPYINDLQGFIISGETSKDILQYNGGFWHNTNSPVFNSLSATTISATTYYGDGSNLSGVSTSGGSYKSFVLTGGTSYTFTDFNTVNTLAINKTTGSSTTVILNQTPSTDDFYVVKDKKGDSYINPITISGGTYLVDGVSSVVLSHSAKPSLTFLFDGDSYIII